MRGENRSVLREISWLCSQCRLWFIFQNMYLSKWIREIFKWLLLRKVWNVLWCGYIALYSSVFLRRWKMRMSFSSPSKLWPHCKAMCQLFWGTLEYVNGSTLKFPCVSNAECKTQDNIPECTCSDGYIHSVNRECYLAHGQPCSESKSCDQFANLVCKNGRCECQDLHIYEETRSLCIGLVGAKCSINDNFCHAGSSCHSSRFNIRD